MQSYYDSYFLGTAKIMDDANEKKLVDIPMIVKYVSQIANNDPRYNRQYQLENEYPPGSEIEAQIMAIKRNGLFVEFGLKGKGLIHNSNLRGFSQMFQHHGRRAIGLLLK